MKIEVLGHASVKLTGKKTIYVDPYHIQVELKDADYIFITHDHYDHYDEKSIQNVRKDTTKIIVPTCLQDKTHDLVVEPGKHYQIDDFEFDTIPAYNLDKPFHPREKNYVGYNICLEDEFFYIMGDTDRTPETDQVKADICFVPIGGTYTMDVAEAIEYINDLHPQVAIPIHYGSITGSLELADEFKEKVNKEIKVEIKIGE